VRPIYLTALIALALIATGCSFGKQGVDVPSSDPNRAGAELFATRCSGCHTLSAAGSQGSGNRGQRTQGPNLDQRVESKDEALYAIQNGGFSGAIMPQNIVVGDEAQKVADFVAEYSGTQAVTSPRPGETAP